MQFENVKEGTKVIKNLDGKNYCGCVEDIISQQTIRVSFGDCSGLYSADELVEIDQDVYDHYNSLPKERRALMLSFNIVDLECSTWDEVDSEMWEDEVDYVVNQEEDYIGERMIGNEKYNVWECKKLSSYIAQKI